MAFGLVDWVTIGTRNVVFDFRGRKFRWCSEIFDLRGNSSLVWMPQTIKIHDLSHPSVASVKTPTLYLKRMMTFNHASKSKKNDCQLIRGLTDKLCSAVLG